MTKYEQGKIVNGCVTGIEKYGIFIGLDQYYSGLIHISEISDGFVRDINDYVSIGETIKAKVLEIDNENFQVKLSIKNLNYRINHKSKPKIQETGTGFDLLKEHLNEWINDKKSKKST